MAGKQDKDEKHKRITKKVPKIKCSIPVQIPSGIWMDNTGSPVVAITEPNEHGMQFATDYDGVTQLIHVHLIYNTFEIPEDVFKATMTEFLGTCGQKDLKYKVGGTVSILWFVPNGEAMINDNRLSLFCK